ncbi:MAG: aminotransferase class III-fold pyridoxal phosphate-dependent enzyme, partial [Deltaproteobacteria bacterium]|nr:aminotransferase class III-fold pyridoxal phosphate-dependent enzyme [Deltaproteobacteria bacterium]
RTITIISFYSEDPDVEARRGFGPFTPGFKISKFNDVEDLKSKVNDTTIAVLLEPIQGEGGIIPAEPSFYSLIHELSKKFNFLVIADEIQCGLFRAGTLTCSEQYNIKPDILILGKSLGGGLIPLSAVLANSHIFAPMGIGSHGSTYGGSPLASRVGLEVVRFISKNRENLEMQITHKGKMLTEALLQLKSKHPIISDVRGKGLMLGLELECPVDQFVKKCFELGLILGKTRSNTVRLTPPLVISEDELYFAVECIDKALSCIDLSCC